MVTTKAHDGTDVAFDDSKPPMAGGMKDVYFSPDRSYVVAFFRDKVDVSTRERIDLIVGRYRDGIFSQSGGEYWRNLYCWPTKSLEYRGKLGLVAPTYPSHFFFKHGSINNDFLGIKGKDKEGKWFANPNHRFHLLDERERGDWRTFLRICINISRAVRRMHAAGLAHSDLSYKNVLIDPQGGNACIIDIDGLVVPGKFPPGVAGTPDFIAPEVIKTGRLSMSDRAKCLPRRETDLHALAVLIYYYLLNRHPLKGRKVHDIDDTARDEELAMGERALFVEDLRDRSNRYDLRWLRANYPPQKISQVLPFEDLDQLPCSILGRFLTPLVMRAFGDGLHNPAARPTADDWETALVKTWDLLQPCANPQCKQKWYAFDNTTKPRCPFCQAPYVGQLPVLNFYSKRPGGAFGPDGDVLMVYHNQYLFPWHASRRVYPNEKLTAEMKKRVGYFSWHNGQWLLVNESLQSMFNVTGGKREPIAVRSSVALVDNCTILLSAEDGGRLVQVQLVTQ